jgi:hypothetical protein
MLARECGQTWKGIWNQLRYVLTSRANCGMPGYFRRVGQWEAQLFPCAEAALQRTHTLNSQLLQLLRHPGAGRFVGSSAVEHDLPIFGQ